MDSGLIRITFNQELQWSIIQYKGSLGGLSNFVVSIPEDISFSIRADPNKMV